MPPRRAPQESVGLGKSNPIPAPIKGLNTREGFVALGPDEARVLENWLPDQGACYVRPGYSHYSSFPLGATADMDTITVDSTLYTVDSSLAVDVPSVPTLATYKGASGTKLIAGASGGLWDVSGVTPTPVYPAGSYTTDRWVTESFNGYLFGVNASDTPWRYDGTTVSPTGFSGSGLTLANLQTVALVKGRLWFSEKNSADVWYGPSAGITGTLTKFQLSQIAQGGKCVGIGAWSYEGGGGPNDQTVFMMDTGEILIYGGDPATTFAKVGSFMAPKPVGVQPFVKVGGELVIITAAGPMPVSFVYRGVAFDLTELQVWGKIAPSWQADYQSGKSYSGFFGHYFNGLLYFNIPLGYTASKQYVLNTRVSGWTTYTSLPVYSMADYSGALYFGSSSNGFVDVHTTGTDNGSPIITIARQGFSFPMGKDKNVLWTMIRPNLEADGTTSAQVQVDVDFSSDQLDSPVVELIAVTTGASWGDPWGASLGSQPEIERLYISITGFGCAVAPVLRTYSTGTTIPWYSSDLVGTQGGIL